MVAAPFEQVPSARAAVDEPGPAHGRPDARPDQEPDLLALEEFTQIVEYVNGVPLETHGADSPRALGRRHDR